MLIFREDWHGSIDLLFSFFDVMMSRPRPDSLDDWKPIKSLMQDDSKSYFSSIKRRLINRSQGYGDYVKYISDSSKGSTTEGARVMVDSGGFSLASRSNTAALKKRGIPIEDPEKAQLSILQHQLRLEPDFVVTLDRIIDAPRTMSLREKKKRVDFSLECAKTALEFKADQRDNGGSFSPHLLAAIHPHGPKYDRTTKEVAKTYAESCEGFLNSLLDFEDGLGETFDGYSVGSLIPLTVPIVEEVGRAVSACVGENKAGQVLLHGLGMTGQKMKVLVQSGFTSFDTNLHMRLARSKIYLTSENERIKIDDLDRLNCNCKVCSNHTLSELRERRKGLREISTVLIGLHNFYTYRENMLLDIATSAGHT